MTKNDKKWKIEFEDKPWSTISEGVKSEGQGYYRISFEGHHYGFISKEAWDDKSTGEILAFVEQMLNDTYSLALKEHD